jgi:hypothetical protein
MDRIESGLDPAGSILLRLSGPNNRDRTVFSPPLIRRLAQGLYLPDLAYGAFVESLPRDAYLKIEAAAASRRSADVTADFVMRLKDMYLKWARARRRICSVRKMRQARASYATTEAPPLRWSAT